MSFSSPNRSSLPPWFFLLLAAALLVAVPPVMAAGGASSETEDEAESEAAEKESEERVYTNEDLQRYQSKAGRRGAQVVDLRARTGTPGAGTKDGVAAIDAAEKKRRMAELEKEIQEAEERIRAIDARERSLHNPFLPRPALTEKEVADEAGMDSRQKLEQLQAERAALAKKLPGLRADLEVLARTPTLPADAGPPGRKPGESGEKPTPEPDRPKP